MSCHNWPNNNNNKRSNANPIRATVPVSSNLRQHTSSIESDGLNIAKETINDESPKKCSSIFIVAPTRGEKSRTLDLRVQPQEHFLRRTASLDAIYHASPSKTESFYVGHFTIDKATQTPEEWSEEYQSTACQWKPMVSAGEQLEVKFIRQKLQRTNQNNKASGSGSLLCYQRQSPVQADHSAISPANGNSTAAVHKTLQHSSGPIPIAHGPRLNVPGSTPNSVEGLNLEIEKLVLKVDATSHHDGEMNRILEPPPEGHRAPIAELFHSVQNSATAGRESRGSSGGTSSRSHSISPAIPIIPGNLGFSISPFSDDMESAHKQGTSPHINYFLSREPPDGCERATIVDEPRCPFSFDLFAGSSKPEVAYVLLPSQSSAFCPLYKELERSTSSPLFNSYTVMSPAANHN